MSALTVADLHVKLRHSGEVLKGVNLELHPGRVQGLLGESGSGKTITGMAVLGLLPKAAQVSGRVILNGKNLLSLGERDLRRIRGRHIGMVFQDPSTSLHPMLTVGRQLTDHMREHLSIRKPAAMARAAALLKRVQIPDPEHALNRFPHQFSGGQRQRIAIAIALSCEPQVLIADEPTTALDVTVQAGVLRLIRGLADEEGVAVLFVTHDLGVMSAIADDVAVMRNGAILEAAERENIFTDPRHPYTQALLNAMPARGTEFGIPHPGVEGQR